MSQVEALREQSSTIRFVLDGEVIELHDVEPTRTVLQFLREDLRRTGTKEGCAEGDCGACTVVLAELDRDGKNIEVHAVNSCIQFLPTLDGKELITVESLAPNCKDLHPVQQALVEHHGSQCGFCTPGFVMSLFALFKSNSKPSRRQIDDALAGNLCRCTGYRPIIDAANAMYKVQISDDWLRQSAGQPQKLDSRVTALKSIQRSKSLSIECNGHRFFAPKSTDELAKLLSAYPQATVLAGGTDIGLWVTKQHRELETVVYTGCVQSMRRIDESDTHLEIGAAVTLTEAMSEIIALFPSLEEVLLRFASPPIRNAATLGGNIANGSPIGDTMPALMVLNASLLLRSATGVREVLLDDFYHAYMQNDLQDGEFVETVRIPVASAQHVVRSYKISKRFDQDISAICGAYRLELDGGRINDARIAYGGMAATVSRARHCENALIGQQWNAATVTAAQAALSQDFKPIDDMRSTASYRMKVAQNLLTRLLLDTSGELTQTVYDYGRTA